MNFDNWFGNVQLAEWVLNIGIQSTLLMTVSLFLRRVCRKCSTPLRSNICFMTMLVLLLLPISLYISRDLSPVRIYLNRSSTSIESPETNNTDIVNANPALNPILHQREPSGQSKWQHLPIYVVNFLGIIWLAGTLLMAIRLGYGFAHTQKIISKLSKMKHDRLIPLLDAVMDVFGITHPPDIYTSMWTKSPQTVGLLTPCIVLPSYFYEKANDEEIKSVLLHEMSHIYHNDQWTGLLQRIIATVFWWNPLTYGLSADFSYERESVCDMYASRHGNPKAFANCLFHLAWHVKSLKVLPTALCAMKSTGSLEKRIHKILSGGPIMKTTLGAKTSLFHVMISIVVAGLLLSVNLTMADQPSIFPPKGEVDTDLVAENVKLSSGNLNIAADEILKENKNNTFTLIGNVIATIENSNDGMITTVSSKKASIRMDENQDIKEAIFEGDVYLENDKQFNRAEKVTIKNFNF